MPVVKFGGFLDFRAEVTPKRVHHYLVMDQFDLPSVDAVETETSESVRGGKRKATSQSQWGDDGGAEDTAGSGGGSVDSGDLRLSSSYEVLGGGD